MTGASRGHDAHVELLSLYTLQALPASEIVVAEAQIAACPECRQELENLRPVVGAFVDWPTDVLRPATPLWERLAARIGGEPAREPVMRTPEPRTQPEWEEAAPGIWCKLLATDTDKRRVSMLVRLAPGVDYPPHRHAGVEELHLLDGQLMVDDKKLYPGDYLRSEADTVDRRVWSETGCTCVLMTSMQDIIL